MEIICSKACSWGSCYVSEMNQKYDYWLDEAAKTKNVSLCNNVEGQDAGDYIIPKEVAIYFCRAGYALKTHDLQYCLSLDSFEKYPGTRPQRDECLPQLIEKLGRTDLCSDVTSYYRPSICNK